MHRNDAGFIGQANPLAGSQLLGRVPNPCKREPFNDAKSFYYILFVLNIIWKMVSKSIILHWAGDPISGDNSLKTSCPVRSEKRSFSSMAKSLIWRLGRGHLDVAGYWFRMLANTISWIIWMPRTPTQSFGSFVAGECWSQNNAECQWINCSCWSRHLLAPPKSLPADGAEDYQGSQRIKGPPGKLCLCTGHLTLNTAASRWKILKLQNNTTATSPSWLLNVGCIVLIV